MKTIPFDWCTLPTRHGDFRMYDSEDEDMQIVCRGDIREQGPEVLLRIHSSCAASEVFEALDCDCADQLREALKLLSTEDRGLVIYLKQEGRGHGLSTKIKAVSLMQREGLDTAAAFEKLDIEQDPRSYIKAVNLLRLLGITKVRLLSNNPRKANYLRSHGFVVTQTPTHPLVRRENASYLRSKNEKLGHTIPLQTPEDSKEDILFYHSDQTWGQFSNFSRHSIFMRSKIWPTVEHFYQAQKFTDVEYQERIRLAVSPMVAKDEARRLVEKSLQREDWPVIKESVMQEALRAKFIQNPELGILLMSTQSRTLREHTTKDCYWGDGGDGSGANRLGLLLMRVRAELRQEAPMTAQKSSS